MRMSKRIFVIGMVLAALFTGCQKAPENSIVKNKSFDNMVSQANDAENGYDNLESVAEKYDTYKAEFSDKKLHVDVKADAKVEIPKTDKLSVYRVKQKEIDQKFIDKVEKALGLSEKLYDGDVLSARTKQDIEKDIQGTKQEIDQADDDEKKDLQNELKDLQEKYKKAPKSIDWNQYVSTGKLESRKSQYDRNKIDKERYEGSPNGSDLYVVTDGKDGYKKSLCVQNDESFSNFIRYHSSKNLYGRIWSIMAGSSNNNGLHANYGMWQADKKPLNTNFVLYYDPDFNTNPQKYIEECKNEPTTISKEKAQETAEKFLKDIGLNDFQCSDSGLFYELMNPAINPANSNEKEKYRKVYLFTYARVIDGVQASGVMKEKGEYQGGNYRKREWPGERLYLAINDEGIAEFEYLSPIEVTETVVDKTKMKGFEKAKDIFESMITTINAEKDSEEQVLIHVNNVTLGYTRISEENRFDTGLIVPTWNFEGTMGGYRYEHEEGAGSIFGKSQGLLTINAIDGTVINEELGY